MSKLGPAAMTNLEAVNILEKRMHRYHPNDDITRATQIAIDLLSGTNPAASRFSDCHIWEPGDKLDTISDKCEVLIKAADIRALTTQPSTEPLTLDELRTMGDEPVWMVDTKHPQYTGWMQYAYYADEYNLIAFFCFGNEAENTYRADDYGKTWVAYRRPPERREETE